MISTVVVTPSRRGRSVAWSELATLAGFCAYFFFYGLGSFGLVGADEPRYAQIAREMLARHDWITPVLNGTPWLEKPALYYWSAMVSYQLFGVSDWAARVPSAAFSTAMMAAIYLFLRRFRPGAELDAALIAASSAAIIGFARGASTDMPLAATFTIGMLAWYAWLETGHKPWLAGFYLMMALGTLAKGPVAPALAGLTIVMFALVTRGSSTREHGSETRATRFRLIAGTLWLPGILLFLAVALPWYIALQVKTHQFFQVFILQHNLERFGTNLYRHRQPDWYYVPVFLLSVLPWTVYAIAALASAVRAAAGRAGAAIVSHAGGSNSGDADAEINSDATQADSDATHVGADSARRWRLFLLTWIGVPLVLFTLSQSKLPGYILPAIPPCALLLAGWLRTHGSDGAGLALSILHSLVSGLLLGGALLAPYFIVRLHPPAQAVSIAAVAAGVIAIATLLTLRWQGLRVLRFVTLVPVLLGLAFVLRVSAPAIDRTQSARPVAQELAGLDTRGAQLAACNVPRELEYGLDFYRNQPVQRYERGQVPAGDHLLIARTGSEAQIATIVGSRRLSRVGGFPAQRLEFYWVSSRITTPH